MYEIRGDIGDILELTKGLKGAEPAMLRATVTSLNRTATSLRNFLAKQIAGDYRVRQKDVKRELNILKANFRRRVAILYGSGSPGIPLYKFTPSPNRVPSTIRLKSGQYRPVEGISVEVTRGRRKKIKGAFIARMRSGHVGVFRRRDAESGDSFNWWETPGKQRIEELYGPSPIRLLDQDRYQIPADDHAGETLEKNMIKQADYYLKKYKVIPGA